MELAQLWLCADAVMQDVTAFNHKPLLASSCDQDPQLNEKGEAGIPGRAARNAFVLDAARELLPHAQVSTRKFWRCMLHAHRRFKPNTQGAAAVQQPRLAGTAAEQAERNGHDWHHVCGIA